MLATYMCFDEFTTTSQMMDFFGAESFHMSKPTQMLSVQNNFEIVDIEE